MFALTARINFQPSRNCMFFKAQGGINFPKLKIQNVDHEAAYLGEESRPSHVCKQHITNLSAKRNIDDEPVSRQSNYYSDSQANTE